MKKILIVEDDTAIAELERDYLEADGFAAHIAADGTKGLELAQKEAYDLLLLDVMLPGADGFQIVREVRKEKDSPPAECWCRYPSVTCYRGNAPTAPDARCHRAGWRWPG